jgi:hypothetical protein
MPVGFINELIASGQSDDKLLVPMNGIILFAKNTTPSHIGGKPAPPPAGAAAPSVLIVAVLGKWLNFDIPAA